MVDHSGIVHWAGVWLRAGSILRQRCGWCGAILIDIDLSATAMMTEDAEQADPEDPRCGIPTWETGLFIVHDGNYWSIADTPPEDGPTPSNYCIAIDPTITGDCL